MATPGYAKIYFKYWSIGKKLRILSAVSLCAYAALLQGYANSSGFGPQAILYDKSFTEMSYTVWMYPCVCI